MAEELRVAVKHKLIAGEYNAKDTDNNDDD
jgi:hypothetical protein